MAENNMSTSVKEVTFNDVIAEFEKPQTPTETPKNFVGPTGPNPVLDNPIKKEEPKTEGALDNEKQGKVEEENKKEEKKFEGDINSVLDREDDSQEEDKKEPGDFIQALKQLQEEDVLFPFDEDKPFEQYTAEDIKELLKANIDHHKKEALNSEIGEFFESLPKEIQYAAKYVADGGTDLKGLFKALAGAEEIRSLDAKDLKDREAIIREYYRAIDWGTDDEINEELDRIKELGESELEKMAGKYKPKLEKMHREVIEAQLARQEKSRQAQEQEMNNYLENAQEAILAGKIGDIQLDKKTQAALWAGLTQPGYQTRRGASTNELGHLLEKYQYIEPNFEKIYKVLWLLRDEKGFEEAIAKKAKNESASSTIRVLKTEQGKKTPTGVPEPNADGSKKTKKVLPRSTPSFLSGLKP